MDCNLFSLYVNLKGAKQVSSLLGVPEDDLIKFLPQVGFNNQEFFLRAIECVKDLKLSTDLKTASQFFQISEEMVRALTEDDFNAGFLNTAKELILGKIEKKCSKATQTSNDFLKTNEIVVPQTVNLTYQVPNSPCIYQYPGMTNLMTSSQSIQGSQGVQSNLLNQSLNPMAVPQFHVLSSNLNTLNTSNTSNTLNTSNTPNLVNNTVKVPSQVIQGSMLTQQVTPPVPASPKSTGRLSTSSSSSLTPSISKSLLFSHVKKMVNISIFKDQRPVQGNLLNPDYSFHAGRQVS